MYLLFPYQRFRSTGGRPVGRIRTNIESKFFALPSLGKASEKNLLPLYRQYILLLEVVAFGVLSGLLMCSAPSRRRERLLRSERKSLRRSEHERSR